VIALGRSEVQRSGVMVETRLSDDVHYVPLILADRIQLQQVILNLIVNAIEAATGSAVLAQRTPDKNAATLLEFCKHLCQSVECVQAHDRKIRRR
jgi:C4-dicarboxylate-specific signal transduction histidine kinase